MLRRLKVRTRLIAVIALPLVLLLIVAVPEVRQRWVRAEDADQAAALAAESADVASAVDALQAERVLSAALRAGADEGIATALDGQRTTTDGAVERAMAAFARLVDEAPELQPVTSRAAGQIAALDLVRDETDAARSIVPWQDPFAPLLDALLTVEEELGALAADGGIADELAQVGLVARAKDAASAQMAQLAAATTWEELRADQAGTLADLRADELAYRTAYLAGAPADVQVARRNEVQRGAVTTAGRVVDEVVADVSLDAAGELGDWLELGAERQVVLRAVESARATEALDRANALGDALRRASTGYGVLAASGLLLALIGALFAARSITGPLRRLTVAADHLATDRLPKLVDALRHPGDQDERFLSAALEPIEVRSDDELAHLGRAFNAIQAVAVDVAAEQSELLRKGISDLYVNLARRNQALIERQIQLLDRLEVGEQDPETLEHLYLLDHLATRMRRNAESLLVLAGAESGPRRVRSLPMVDVVRAALSEVEDYERIDLGALADATLQGPAVSDVAHILAELLENATHFSPPDTPVRIDGTRTGGSYQLVISDRGVGIKPEQLDSLNTVLREPPVTGLALGRSLGCLVAARLASRHGITVRLRPGDGEGVSAYVILPRHLVADDVLEPLPDTFLSLDERLHERPDKLRDALPVASFDAGLQALLDGDAPPPLVEPPVRRSVPAPDPVDDRPPPARHPEWDPAPVAAGAAGPDALVRRVPGATTEAEPIVSDEARIRRSPDEVRKLLSRYRSGLQAGRAGERSDAEEDS
ncbi:MAG: sensor histidine kinase [Acidimicrobiales bacterium]